MKLNSSVRALAEEFLPGFVLRWLDPFDDRMRRELRGFARQLSPGVLVLDAGAGESRFRGFFEGQRYVAVDNRVGDATWDYSHLDVVADLENLPFVAGQFDAVINIVVLEHSREPLRILREMGRVLRPGGRLFLVAPCQWEVHQAPHDYFRFTRCGLEHLLTESGLAIERLDPVGGFFWLMSRRCINCLTFFQGGLRWPFFFVLAPFLGFIFPLLFYFADPLDHDQDFTLGYISVAKREVETTHSLTDREKVRN